MIEQTPPPTGGDDGAAPDYNEWGERVLSSGPDGMLTVPQFVWEPLAAELSDGVPDDDGEVWNRAEFAHSLPSSAAPAEETWSEFFQSLPSEDRACPQCANAQCADPLMCKRAEEAVQRNRRSLDVVSLDEVITTRVVYVWKRRIPRGALTLMPGVEGVGKTTLGIRIMADLTRGTLPGQYFGKPQYVLVLAFEDGLGDVIKPRFEQAGADLSKVIVLKCARKGAVEDGRTDRIVVPRDLDLIAERAKQYGAVFVWIDSLVTTLPDDLKTIAYKETASALKAINEWASENRLAVVSPWHLNKADSTDARVRMMDSRAFATATRSILLVVEDPDSPGTGKGIVAVDKSNASASHETPALRYHLISAEYTVEEEDEETGVWAEVSASCGVAQWDGEIEGNGREIARAMLARPTTLATAPDARLSAVDWLTKYLTDNEETWSDQVILDGELAEYSRSAIKRAATKIRVVYAEEIVPREGTTPLRKTTWKLPE